MFRLLFWNLRHRRWRHVLNAIMMAITVAVVMLFVSVIVELVAFRRISADRELARLLVWPRLLQPGGSTGLPLSLYPTFQAIEGVKVVQRNKLLSGRHESGATYIISGEEESGIELNTDFFPVEKADFEAWKKEQLGAIVTEETARELNLKVGQLAEIPTPFGPMQIKVVGLSKGALIGHRIAPHFKYVQELTGNTGTTGYRIFTKPNDMERVAAAVIEQTKNTPTPATAFSDAEAAKVWVRRVGMVPALLGFLGAFLMFTTALTLANNSAISIRERRTETATLRVLGYKRRAILGIMLLEAVLIGILGAVLAIAVTTLAFKGGIQLTPGADRLLQKVTIGPMAMGIGMLVAIVVPLVGALPAALASVRTPLVSALRDTA